MSRFLLPLAALALTAGAASAQRPALTGEKAQVAEAVKADLSRLSELQTAHHNRTRVYAADARDLNFTPASGATINIAYASMNAWAANATHPTLSPVACFIIISAQEPTGPAAQPFCQEGRPGSTGTPAGAAGTTSTTTPTTAPTTPTTAPRTEPTRTETAPPRTAPRTEPARTETTQGTTPTPRTDRPPMPRTETAVPTTVPMMEQGMTPAQPAQPLRPAAGAPSTTAGPGGARPAAAPGAVLPLSDIPASARAGTRDIAPAGLSVPTQNENVSAQEFSRKLAEFAQGALAMTAESAAELERIVRDPYESTAEFQARRAAAVEAAQRRDREFFQRNSKTYTVALPVREVRYDPDREIFEFTVDGIGLPVTRGEGGNAGTLTLSCYTRPVFWCSPEAGMTYEAGDMWKIPRGTARQFDILRTPLTLSARFAVGRRTDASVLAISLVSMDLQARGQSVSRWDGTSR